MAPENRFGSGRAEPGVAAAHRQRHGHDEHEDDGQPENGLSVRPGRGDGRWPAATHDVAESASATSSVRTCSKKTDSPAAVASIRQCAQGPVIVAPDAAARPRQLVTHVAADAI